MFTLSQSQWESVSDFIHQGIKLIPLNLKWIMAKFGYVLSQTYKIKQLKVHSSTVKPFLTVKQLSALNQLCIHTFANHFNLC